MDVAIDVRLRMSVERRGGPHSRNQRCGNSALESRALCFAPLRVTRQLQRTYSARLRFNRVTSMFNADEERTQDVTRAEPGARRATEKVDESEQ